MSITLSPKLRVYEMEFEVGLSMAGLRIKDLSGDPLGYVLSAGDLNTDELD